MLGDSIVEFDLVVEPTSRRVLERLGRSFGIRRSTFLEAVREPGEPTDDGP
jgi:hypothetical protein